jgi:hypothetical protein
MRKAAMAASMLPVDNRRGKKRVLEDVHAVLTVHHPNNNNAADSAVLAQTLEHLEAETLEKEEKQHHGICVRLVRDKLAACKRRSDMLLQQLQLSSKYKKKTDTTMLDKLKSNETEIEKIESELVALQEEECGRHRQMLEKKRCMVVARARSTSIETIPPMIGKDNSFESFSGLESSSSGGNAEDDDNGNDGDVGNNGDSRNDGVSGNGNGSTYPATSTQSNTTTCMECNCIPIDHVFSKCK